MNQCLSPVLWLQQCVLGVSIEVYDGETQFLFKKRKQGTISLVTVKERFNLKDSVIAIFEQRSQAENAAKELIRFGFNDKDVVVALPQGDMGMHFGGVPIRNESIESEEIEHYAIFGGANQPGTQGASPVTINGLLAIVAAGRDMGEYTEDVSDLNNFIGEHLAPDGAVVVVHPNADSISAFEILNSCGGKLMDSTRPEEKSMYEAYNLKQVPVGEIFEETTQDATEGGNFSDTMTLDEDETIPIPAHIISEYGFIDPNIGPGNKDLLFNEFAEEDGIFDPETRDELSEEMVEEQERFSQE
jgi:hypothetical protein